MDVRPNANSWRRLGIITVLKLKKLLFQWGFGKLSQWLQELVFRVRGTTSLRSEMDAKVAPVCLPINREQVGTTTRKPLAGINNQFLLLMTRLPGQGMISWQYWWSSHSSWNSQPIYQWKLGADEATRKTSSANKAALILQSPTSAPRFSGNNLRKLSITILKMIGDRGSPCFTSRFG